MAASTTPNIVDDSRSSLKLLEVAFNGSAQARRDFELAKWAFQALIIACKKPLQTSSYYETNYATGQTTQRNGIALPQGKENYPIDVFFKPDKPSFEVELIQEIKLSQEDLNSFKEKIVKGRMVQRGKNADEKKLLIAALVEKAENLGASCLYDVTYQYYTTTSISGYIISGLAGKYSLSNVKN